MQGNKTFSWASGNVGCDLWSIGKGFSTDAEVVGHSVCQILDFHPQGGAALQSTVTTLLTPELWGEESVEETLKL